MANLNLEIDGKALQVAQGSTVMDAANQIGAYIPHFCYHKKLSIAANCRMCLVQVEKAPKPLPACATPVTEGMKVQTASEYAKNAQKSVMEFLLINHPLDCPICDQGGECQLQDLAVGYGKSSSRYQEEKRIVFHKNVGPLISMEEMSRCIHCTRCVRFGQEVAGVMELGMGGRGEHSEIQSFIGRTIDSELSGNMIDVCPVGALTSKPFRYSARTWELQRKRSVSPHDGIGTNLTVQVKNNTVLRVLPFENEAINECWISDRDRFSYEGLNVEDRLTTPMVKQGGEWQRASWQQALEYVAHALSDVKANHGGESIAMLSSPTATVEELFLFKTLASALNTTRVDARPRMIDELIDSERQGVPFLGMKIAEINSLDRILIVGSSLRAEQPLIAARLRKIARKTCKVMAVTSLDDDPLLPIAAKAVVRSSEIAFTLDAITYEVERRPSNATVHNASVIGEIASTLVAGKNVAIFLGELALNCAHAGAIERAVERLANACGARWGRFAAAGNTVGVYVLGLVGETASKVAMHPPKAAVLWNIEPSMDTAAGASLNAALADASTVVACITHLSAAPEHADVLLPISAFTETSGTYINCEGRAQSVQAVVRPLGDSRPGWKVLRVLAEMLGAKNIEFDTSEAVKDAALSPGWEQRLENRACGVNAPQNSSEIERLVDIPIYQSDILVRRAVSLQKAGLSKVPSAQISPDIAAKLKIQGSARVRLSQGGGACELDAVVVGTLPSGTIRVPAGQLTTAALGNQAAKIAVECI